MSHDQHPNEIHLCRKNMSSPAAAAQHPPLLGLPLASPGSPSPSARAWLPSPLGQWAAERRSGPPCAAAEDFGRPTHSPPDGFGAGNSTKLLDRPTKSRGMPRPMHLLRPTTLLGVFLADREDDVEVEFFLLACWHHGMAQDRTSIHMI